jgi:hypothetical protein
MNRKSFAAAFALLLARPAYGQVVNLWPGVAPGSEHWTQQERAVENTPIAAEWGIAPDRVGVLGFSG